MSEGWWVKGKEEKWRVINEDWWVKGEEGIVKDNEWKVMREG